MRKEMSSRTSGKFSSKVPSHHQKNWTELMTQYHKVLFNMQAYNKQLTKHLGTSLCTDIHRLAHTLKLPHIQSLTHSFLTTWHWKLIIKVLQRLIIDYWIVLVHTPTHTPTQTQSRQIHSPNKTAALYYFCIMKSCCGATRLWKRSWWNIVVQLYFSCTADIVLKPLLENSSSLCSQGDNFIRL